MGFQSSNASGGHIVLSIVAENVLPETLTEVFLNMFRRIFLGPSNYPGHTIDLQGFANVILHI